MTAQLLTTKRVDKPLGRRELWTGFPDPAPSNDPVGEVWSQTPLPDPSNLLIKNLVTSGKLLAGPAG